MALRQTSLALSSEERVIKDAMPGLDQYEQVVFAKTKHVGSICFLAPNVIRRNNQTTPRVNKEQFPKHGPMVTMGLA